MKLQDCIDIIRNCTTLACEYHIKNKCDYGYEVRENRFECAKKLAIKALEKQIAKDVYEAHFYREPFPIYRCPVCPNTSIERNQVYCQDCGQKLDWSEV